MVIGASGASCRGRLDLHPANGVQGLLSRIGREKVTHAAATRQRPSFEIIAGELWELVGCWLQAKVCGANNNWCAFPNLLGLVWGAAFRSRYGSDDEAGKRCLGHYRALARTTTSQSCPIYAYNLCCTLTIEDDGSYMLTELSRSPAVMQLAGAVCIDQLIAQADPIFREHYHPSHIP